ncbi:clathrin-associated AP-2 complex component [Spraguea lophii 42_110]|uniref:Clathrin-associated AP-2 complex component n=1 Tax=Spraguea lophii (strain 42_110) TaxID=1358809 RepID=S7XGR4_SPRLO|nr:clathrin-associated AP-2 complex component [Spraguea lophii 42_110]
MIEELYIFDLNKKILLGDPQNISIANHKLLKVEALNGLYFSAIVHSNYFLGATHFENEPIVIESLLKEIGDDIKIEDIEKDKIKILRKINQLYLDGFQFKKKKIYNKNEILFKIKEKMDIITNDRGGIIKNVVRGELSVEPYAKKNLRIIFQKNKDMQILSNIKIHETETTVKMKITTDEKRKLLEYNLENPIAPPLKLLKKQHNWYVLEVKNTIIENLQIKIPVPPECYNLQFEIDKGVAKQIGNNLFIKIQKLEAFRTNIKLKYNVVKEPVDPLPPITMNFVVNLFSSSGFLIKKIIEDEVKKAEVWAKYSLEVESYEIRNDIPYEDKTP